MKIFILEDETWYGAMLRHYISLHPGCEARLFDGARELLSGLHLRPDAIIAGYRLRGSTAADVLRAIREQLPDTPVVITSGPPDAPAALDLLREGVYDCLVKDDHTQERIAGLLARLRQLRALQTQIDALSKEATRRYDLSAALAGGGPPMRAVLALVETACANHSVVALCGEAGTGKALAARTIHYNSLRQDKPFVTLNVAALPAELLARELFGYEKGAFPGAAGRHVGKLEAADGGTLFLEDIGDLDMGLQRALLRVLQERALIRIGGDTPVPVNVRLIVSTQRDLSADVGRTFHAELYDRLFGQRICVPPLRERGSDVLELAQHFIHSFCRTNGKPLKTLSAAAREKLLAYSFPGNVRELRSLVELGVVLADGGEIGSGHIHTPPAAGLNELFSTERTLREYERRIIQHYLERYRYDVLFVADKLGIGKSTIYRMIQVGELCGRPVAGSVAV